ncbi:MAG: SelB C-terminal domain-containing protein [Candidatus Aminicenantaceae bacterium]
MRSQRFDARLNRVEGTEHGTRAQLTHGGHRFGVEVRPYEPSGCFVQITVDRPVEVFWGEGFILLDPEGRREWASGTVLDPGAHQPGRSRKAHRLAFLEALGGGEKEMLLVLIESKGVKGLTESELEGFASLPEKDRHRWAQDLEADGQIKILTFEPLFLLAESSFSYLCDKLQDYIEKQHRDKPDLIGITHKSLRARFRIPERVNLLALKALQREGRILWTEDRVLPADFRIEASPDEEKILAELEELSLKGEFKRVSLEEIRKRLRISTDRLNRLLALLIERKKVIQGKDGFLLHSQWLDEVVAQLHSWGRDEISIAEFKAMTGLSRKYAIPLLELLDQLGITRRRGSHREIL